MSTKDIISEFYNLNLAKADNQPVALELFHKDCEIDWNSSKGVAKLDYEGFSNMLLGIKESFFSFTYKISHLFADTNQGAVRYTIFGTTIEEPEIAIPLGHFISIVEVKDQKIHRVFQISQEADENILNMSLF